MAKGNIERHAAKLVAVELEDQAKQILADRREGYKDQCHETLIGAKSAEHQEQVQWPSDITEELAINAPVEQEPGVSAKSGSDHREERGNQELAPTNRGPLSECHGHPRF